MENKDGVSKLGFLSPFLLLRPPEAASVGCAFEMRKGRGVGGVNSNCSRRDILQAFRAVPRGLWIEQPGVRVAFEDVF